MGGWRDETMALEPLHNVAVAGALFYLAKGRLKETQIRASSGKAKNERRL